MAQGRGSAGDPLDERLDALAARKARTVVEHEAPGVDDRSGGGGRDPADDGDPTVDIGNLRRVALVIKNGEAYYPAEIDRALGIEPFAEPVKAVPTGDAAP